jgi:butyryl-CoA dehydrogenase
MSTSLTENLQRIRASAVAFADEFLEPIAADLDRSGNFPQALVAELARQQLLTLPAAGHAGFVAHVETLETLSQACPAVASFLNNHALAAYAIFKWGSDAQKSAHLSELGEGEKLGALALNESGPALGIGADALMGVLSGGKLTLNGRKVFVRNAGVADVYVGFASVGGPGAPSVTGFIVDAKTPGISVGASHFTMGLRGCPVADVIFKNVMLDEASLLGTSKDGPAMLAELLSALALGDAAQTVGIGKAAARHAAAAARHRIQFGHPIATLQAIQQLLAEIAADAHLAWLGVRHAAQLTDDGAPFAVEAAMVKSFLGRFGQKILIDAIQIEGGMGICEVAPPHFEGTLPLARLFRDMAGTTLLDAPDDFPESLVAASL